MGIPLGSQFDLNAGLPIRKYEVVANTTERDAIPDIVRYDGFETYVEGDQKYRLEGGITNSDWIGLDSSFNSPLTTKGDLLTYSSVDVRLPVGTDGQILSADSTETTGLKWIDQPSSMIYPAAGIAVSNGTGWDTSITPSTGYLYYDGSTFSWESVSSSLWSQNGSDIYYNGNVGIGTSSPQTQLQIGDNTGSEKLLLFGSNSNTTSSEILFGDNTSGASPYYNGMGIRFDSANNYLSIDDNIVANTSLIAIERDTGNVGINKTNPDYTLDVGGNGRFTSTVTATNFILSSDIKLKENINKLNDSTDIISFNFKNDNEKRKRYGIIAQEIEKNNPELVYEDKEGYKQVAYIDYLLMKMAEKDKQINNLESRIEKLEKII